MEIPSVSEYNRDQWISFQAILKVMGSLSSTELEALRSSIGPYLQFRRSVDEYQARYFDSVCSSACFETSLSACCSFESIITFFADQVITTLCSQPEEIELALRTLERPNTGGKCVYLGSRGCILHVRPVSCAMFLCDTAKRSVFEPQPEVEQLWEALREREKGFTWPTQPVLFDYLEEFFMQRGAQSRHMFFHRGPGLLRMKAKAGITARSYESGIEAAIHDHSSS